MTTSSTTSANDASLWDAMPSVIPKTSLSYPAIGATLDASDYAKAFATQLLTRNYSTSTRDDLISWAQWEDSPLRSPNYPAADWSKVLVDSLTDLTWDDASDTAIPADGPWLALASEQASQTVSQLDVSMDQTWERYIAAGNQPPDPLATARDVSATITQTKQVAGATVTTVIAVSFVLQVGSSPRHEGYAAAVVNNYKVKEVS